MLGDMGRMMKQAKEMKKKLKEAEKELASLEVTGESRNKLVSCVVNGKMDLKSVRISPDLVEKKDVSLLEKSVMEAVSSALGEAQKSASSRLSGVTGGLNIPGL